MNIYERLIENPLFFKWIYHPTREIESYWENYLQANGKEADEILEFKSQFENYFKYNEQELSEIEKRNLAERIIKKLEKEAPKVSGISTFKILFRYAAVAILFLLLGGSLVYVYLEQKQDDTLVENFVLPTDIQKPTLIMEKQKIQLESGTSELDYTKKDEIVLNGGEAIKKDTKGETPTMNTLVIPYGNRSVITLADGSVVWLNAGSRLIYPSEFVNKTREVFLVGEAFFDITKSEKQPFVVKTTGIKIAVMGTKFNVSAYPEDYSVQTVLAEGRVKINRTNTTTIFEKGLELVPGQMAYYNKKSQDMRIINVDVESYTLWTQGLLNFSNTDLNRITKRLERYYNITFVYEDPLSGTIQITGKLDVTQEMNEVFEYLSKLTGLSFIKENNKRYLIR